MFQAVPTKTRQAAEVTMHDIGEGTKRFIVFVGTAWNTILKKIISLELTLVA